MKKILLILPFLLFGCATNPIKLLPAPEKSRLKELVTLKEDEQLSPSEKIALSYKEALMLESLGNKDKACTIFKKLSDIEEFTLKQVAMFHKLINCDLSKSEIKSIWKKVEIPQYLKESFLKKSLEISREKKWTSEEASFLFQMVDYSKLQSEKIMYLQKAIDIYHQNHEENLEKQCLDKLKTISPKFQTEISQTNIYVIAKDLEDDRQFEKSRQLLLQIIKNEKNEFNLDQRVKAYNSYRTSFKVERHLKQFLTTTEEMVQFLSSLFEKSPEEHKIKEALVDTKIALARATWTEHNAPKAQKILFEVITSKIGNQNQNANSYWLLGSIELENKKNIKALEFFKKAGEFNISDNALRENIYWSIVWNHFLLNKHREVEKLVNKFTKISSNQNFIDKLLFWKAQALLKSHKENEAQEIFKLLSTNNQFSYYGILSAMYLKLPLHPLQSPLISPVNSLDLELDWLIAVDEKLFAQKRLKEINSKFKTYSQREKALPLYIETGWYQGAAAQIYNLPSKKRAKLTEEYISGIYPTPFLDIINSASSKFEIPKELIYAIIRQESSFESSEKSWAHAYGLMQMIPEKAKDLSQKYQITYQDYNDLFKPEINIQMGTALLSDLLKKSNGSFAQTVAGYNANPKAFENWKQERYNGNFIEFIEMIPYEETRNYIKLVFRNFITYKRIFSQTEFTIETDFFEKAFN